MNELSFDDLTGQMMDLYREGNYAEALQIVERNADRFPDHSARTTFWKMCLLSLCGRPNDMISVFRQGLDSGLWWSKNVFNDSDLNAVRDLPAFQRLMQESQEKYEAVRTQMERDHAVLVPDEPAAEAYPLLIALHGRNGNKESNRREWEAARRKGWLVLLTQSTQPLFPGSYCWDEPAQSLADLLFYYEQICSRYPVEPQHIVLAGFSQGSGMAIHAALDGRIPVCGFISVAIGWSNFEGLPPSPPTQDQSVVTL